MSSLLRLRCALAALLVVTRARARNGVTMCDRRVCEADHCADRLADVLREFLSGAQLNIDPRGVARIVKHGEKLERRGRHTK